MERTPRTDIPARIGLNTPVVTTYPPPAAGWETRAGAVELALIAETADRLGYSHLTCAEHTAVPTQIADERGGTYWDPLATLAYLAARTERITLFTTVLVLGYHHPLQIAKSYGTLDLLSGGRVTLGLGVGSLEAEFALLDAPFEDRGARADDAIDALRAAWGTPRPHHNGPYYAFDSVDVTPSSPRRHVDLILGGRTGISLRRAVRRGDGWVPFSLPHDTVQQMLERAQPPADFRVVLGTPRLDPIAAPEAALAELRSMRTAGATDANVTIDATSASHYLEQLHALAELLA
ncbi:TIGR03619 family F420-dependent LLM class oxidoreductase [Salinibacterium sp. ZJ70]|uniref:TIGR03619 family F420-dependent LLM class oxidoreductase n=1 Tax=Salinibacterium sp. ZJ70 TaxID=2708084 RepID=UPI001423C320|nr:TIGR03619 family F420-dependent LLM class oxidoreductase [Salinibacterium sp. ZJ70]